MGFQEKTFDENFDDCVSMLKEIEFKLEQKVKEKEKSKSPVKEKKNSHLHLMIGTNEKRKLMEKANAEGIPFAEWCRRKLKENDQLDRIENKLDKIAKQR